MNKMIFVVLLVSLLFHKTTGFVTFSLKGMYAPSIKDKLFSEDCLVNSIRKNLPSVNKLDISEWSDDKRSVSFTSRVMGKSMKHYKTQTKFEKNGVLKFTDEDIIDGCVRISINTSWTIEEYKDISIECPSTGRRKS